MKVAADTFEAAWLATAPQPRRLKVQPSSASSYRGKSRSPRRPHGGPQPPSTPPPTLPSPSQ
eukprot:2888603-Amphidinium_carterae.1